MEEFNYKNGFVYYNTLLGERNAIIVSKGDYNTINEVEEEFDKYLQSKEGVLKDAKNRKDLFYYVYACSKGWIK